jgi:hypothetical protein
MTNSTKKMKTFLAIFIGKPSGMKKWEKLPAMVRKERETAGMQGCIRFAL